MATISKTCKIRVNGKDSRWFAFGHAFFDSQEVINVWGRDKDGKLWYQLEHGKELDEPYLDKWWYKVADKNSTVKTHYAPLQHYRWIYRCIQECYDPDVTQRTIVYDGKVYHFTTLFSKNADGDGILHIPIPFGYASDSDRYASSVLRDTTPLMSRTYKGEYEHKSDTATLVCPRDAKEMERRQAVVDASVAEIDKIINDLYGFSPDNKPKTVDAKVKVAKVIHDWLKLNNVYTKDSEWEEQSAYAALSRGENTPVCASYALAACYLLSRYGIVCIYVTGKLNVASGIAHAWNLVNYHADYGTYPSADNEWCFLDCTGSDSVAGLISWSYFNVLGTKTMYVLDDLEYPTYVPADAGHKYTGKKKYGWDVDYMLKESEE